VRGAGGADITVHGPPGCMDIYDATKSTSSPIFSFFSLYVWPSVADPGCSFRIPDPDFYLSRISDPGSKNSSKREGRKNFFVIPFL
jgi:hypothetical protein